MHIRKDVYCKRENLNAKYFVLRPTKNDKFTYLIILNIAQFQILNFVIFV